ncbi:3-dehydroquinate synthase [Candidatus Izimaplasma bacterium HR1]|jgi:3-dehydroquinate synthase|uniref:3-dehydroquinate synthase n=1 Tax=Candidatus Izimoplasma sp. HR1 TaxID=1541959 RepID=UPI0004F6F4DE|nr:3-dehydroquinate synthase [Candidatus Izimaplasma bacterium HR1]
MRTINVQIPNNEYDVVIQKGILSNIGLYIDKSREIVIISDDNIPKIYLNIIKPLLGNPLTLFVPQGEVSKSMETAYSLVNTLIHKGVTRGALIIALGGGVIGDLVGFVSSVYLRGVEYIQIPTTLLSQIDSSVGGKVGINAISMKNAIGSFKQPKLVIIDPNTLKTLDQRQISSGISEMIKYGLIADKSLFYDILNNNIFNSIEDYIYKCVTIKKDIVVEDELDYGRRQLLNYGHTIGHAIEQYSNYNLLHGEAVAIGMMMMAKGSHFEKDLEDALVKYDLPLTYEYDKKSIYNIIKTDKKVNGNKLNIILVEEAGKGFIKTINVHEINERI